VAGDSPRRGHRGGRAARRGRGGSGQAVSRPAAGGQRPGGPAPYGIIVGLEFGLLGAGAAALGATGLSQWIPVWVCFGVGVHFGLCLLAFGFATLLAGRHAPSPLD
jgi:hypothetical protein